MSWGMVDAISGFGCGRLVHTTSGHSGHNRVDLGTTRGVRTKSWTFWRPDWSSCVSGWVRRMAVDSYYEDGVSCSRVVRFVRDELSDTAPARKTVARWIREDPRHGSAERQGASYTLDAKLRAVRVFMGPATRGSPPRYRTARYRAVRCQAVVR